MRDLKVSIIGAEFNRWFPITMVVYTGLLVFEVWDNCLTRAFAKLGRLFVPEKADVEHTERGKELMLAEQDAVMRWVWWGVGCEEWWMRGWGG